MAYSDIKDPSAHFQVLTYTGTSNIHDVTLDGNSDMQPDFVWFKNRDVGYTHQLYDSNRGVTKALYSSGTNAEATISNGLTRFDPDGFRVSSAAAINEDSIVCWNWHANSGTTSSNTDGTVTTTTQVNSDAGFSIVTWAGGGTGTLGHGLGETPDMWIIKNRDYAVSWVIGFSDSNILGGRSKLLTLNTSNAIGTYANLWGTSDAQISSTTIGAAGDRSVNISGNDYVGYFFKAKQGYSKFGKYVGNGSLSNGTFVYLGFKPAFIITKKTSSTSSWRMYDNKRDGYNLTMKYLFADQDNAEATNSYGVDFLSNGFKMRNNFSESNYNGETYIYMAFAENPFVTSTGIPTTAR